MVQIHDESANSSREDRGKLRKPRNRSNPRGGFVSSLPSPPSLTCNPPHVAPVRPLQRCRAPNVDQWAAIAQTSAPSPSCFPAIGNPSPPPPIASIIQTTRRSRGSRLARGRINTYRGKKVWNTRFVVPESLLFVAVYGQFLLGMIFSLTDFESLFRRFHQF